MGPTTWGVVQSYSQDQDKDSLRMVGGKDRPVLKLKDMEEKHLHNLFLKNMSGLIEGVITPLPASTPTQSAEGWRPTRVLPSSWESPGRSLSALRWRPSSSGASAEPGSTTTSTSPSPGPTGSPSAPSSTTSSPMPSTTTPSKLNLLGQAEELRSCFHDWREVCWSARLPHSGGHVRDGGGEEDRSQDDLLLRAGGLQDVQRALVAL